MFETFLRRCLTAAFNPAIALDYALYRMGRRVVTLPPGVRLASTSYSELRTIRNLAPDPREMDVMRSLPSRGVFFDIGAHVGIWSGPLAMMHPAALIHAFEAYPVTFHTLTRNLANNALTNVILNHAAVSDSDGFLQFQAPRNASVFGRIRTDDNSRHRFDNADIVSVPALRLDGYCRANGIKKIDFLKIDVEGAEPRVLRGVLSTVAVDKIWIEVDEDNLIEMGHSIDELATVAAQAGYQFVLADGSSTDIRKRREANMLLIPC